MPVRRSSLGEAVSELALRGATTAGRLTEQAMSRDPRTPRDTGQLAGNMVAQPARMQGSRATVLFTNDDEVAGWLDKGTPPHLIRPRRARVLRFPSRGRVVFARSVNHPGSRKHVGWWLRGLRTHWPREISNGVSVTRVRARG